MNSISNTKCFISSVVELDDLRVQMIKKIQELFKPYGIDMPSEDIRIEQWEDQLYLYLQCFDDLPAQTQQERDLIEAATAIGFSDMGYDNVRTVCEHIFETQLDHTLDSSAGAVVFEFYNESSDIMARIDKLFNEIDNMTAKEAKQSVAGLYAHLKNTYGWSE